MNLTTMKVGKRLGLGFALVLVLLIAVTSLGISRMSLIQDRLEDIVNVSNVKSRLIIDMRAIVYDRQVSLRNLTLLTDIDDMSKDLKKIDEQSKNYGDKEAKLIDMLKGDRGSDAERTLLAKLKDKEKATASLPNLARDAGVANDPEAATITLIKKIRPLQDEWYKVLASMFHKFLIQE
ncbi:MAG: MCP four helix bundle domain-containing protein [Candidatus Aquirickettsiella gammari]